MKIVRNNITGGLYCVIQKNNRYYLADLSDTPDHGPECMIFPCTKEGKVTSWSEVFVELYRNVTEDNLRDSVRKFLAE